MVREHYACGHVVMELFFLNKQNGKNILRKSKELSGAYAWEFASIVPVFSARCANLSAMLPARGAEGREWTEEWEKVEGGHVYASTPRVTYLHS